MARATDLPPRPSRRARTVAAGMLVVLLAAACGTRVPDEEVRRLLSAPARTGETGVGRAAAPSPTPGARIRSTGPSGATPGPSGVTPGAGAGSTNGPDGGGGSRQCSTNTGATDVGVTRTSISLGATYAESSLVPGQFRPAVDAIAAYLDMVNRQGGVCGRLLRWHFHDDGLNAQRYAENVRHLVETDRVFAMLGNLSAADSGACGYMDGQRPPRGVPDIGTFALSYCRAQDDSHYAPTGSLKPGIYGCCAEWQWLRQRFHYRRPAAHYLDIEISRDQGVAVVDGLVRTLGLDGRGNVYQGQHSPAQFSYTGDVQNMRDAGVDAVWSSMDLNGNVKLLRAMCQQSWRPKVVHLESSAYDPLLIQRVGGACIARQNVWIRTFHRPFSNPNEEVSLYLRTLAAFCPDCSPTTFGMEGWLSAKLLVEALERVGPNLTRERLYAALDAVRNWTAGGVMGPNTPADRLIFHCNYMLHVTPQGFEQGSDLLCGRFYGSGDYDGGAVGP